MLLARSLRSLLLSLAILSAAGCIRDARAPTAPAAEEQLPVAARTSTAQAVDKGRSFYPLEIGNRWSYEGWSSRSATPPNGEPITTRSTWAREAAIARAELIGGKEVVREEQVNTVGSQVFPTLRWLRQDSMGLFEIGTPPPTYPFPYEAQLVAYPLHRGASWVVNEALKITATVEAHELIETPAGRFPAWRIRIRHAGHLQQEESFVWYGAAGYLGMRVDLEFKRPDGVGGWHVTTSHEEEWLTGTNVLGHGSAR